MAQKEAQQVRSSTMITIKEFKDKHWDKKLSVKDFAIQMLIVEESKDPIFKMWMQKLLHRFFEGMGENSVRTIGEWSAEIDAFMEHLLSHQPKPEHADSFKLSEAIKLIPLNGEQQ